MKGMENDSGRRQRKQAAVYVALIAVTLLFTAPSALCAPNSGDLCKHFCSAYGKNASVFKCLRQHENCCAAINIKRAKSNGAILVVPLARHCHLAAATTALTYRLRASAKTAAAAMQHLATSWRFLRRCSAADARWRLWRSPSGRNGEHARSFACKGNIAYRHMPALAAARRAKPLALRAHYLRQLSRCGGAAADLCLARDMRAAACAVNAGTSCSKDRG